MDYRFVYILRRRGGQCKIGIAKDTKVRIRDIRRSTDNKSIRLYAKIKVPYAEKFEGWLHNKYSSKQREYKGSGKTEWFDLTFIDRWAILFLFWFISLGMLVACFIVLCIFALILFLIIT